MRYLPIALAILATAAAPAPAPRPQDPTVRPITIGAAHRIDSTQLKEARIVNVVLPAGYAKHPDRTYPVLYLIDGGVEQDLLHVAGAAQLGSVWGRSADAIVVGVETQDRRRELVGPTRDPALLKRYPTAGASAAFRAFLRDEVKPLIARTYRTNGRSAVIGESLAGLFIVETYLAEPEMFDAYAAIDPSLWWDGEALSRTAAGKVGVAANAKAGATRHARPIYLAMAREQAETPAAMTRIVDAVRSARGRWCLARRPDLLHATIYQQLTPQALQFLLPPATPPSPEFGFTIGCDPS